MTHDSCWGAKEGHGMAPFDSPVEKRSKSQGSRVRVKNYAGLQTISTPSNVCYLAVE